MEHLTAITQEETNSLRRKEVAGKQLMDFTCTVESRWRWRWSLRGGRGGVSVEVESLWRWR